MEHTAAETLIALCDAFGPPGFEDDVRQVLHDLVAPLCDEVRTDALGNLMATRRGQGPGVLMLDAHMDEIGFMIQHVTQEGYLRFTSLGSWDPRLLLSHRIAIQTREGAVVTGVIGSLPPHVLSESDRKRPPVIDEMFIDIGADDADEVLTRGVRVGDPAVIHYPATQPCDGWLLGKALDDRAGCAVMVQTLQHFSESPPPVDLVCNFAVCEEVGGRGARTAAHQIRPDLALALEGTICTDGPDVPARKRVTVSGRGPAITVADKSVIVQRRLVSFLEEIADQRGVPWQYKLPTFGSTDAGLIHTTRDGVPSAVLSTPCRYIHAPNSMVRLSDLVYTIELTIAFVEQCPRLISSSES